MKDNQRASVAFELLTQVLQRKSQVRRVSFEPQKADPGSLQHSLKAQLLHFGGFCDGRCRLGKGPKVLACVPDVRRRYGEVGQLSELLEMSFLRVEPRFGSFEQDIHERRRLILEAPLQGGVRELRILNGVDDAPSFFHSLCAHGKGARVSRQRVQAKNSTRDYAKSAEGSRGELGQIVARDVLDDLAPAAGPRAIGKRERNADDQIA